MKMGGEKTMTLEEYVNFSVSKESIDLTISYLNQILHMHGFRKLHKTPKKIVGEAVDALDLLDLSRSTLKQTTASSSSPSSSLTLDEVITDIEALKWQECRLTSLEIISPEKVTRETAKSKQNSKKRKTTTMKKSVNDNLGDENENNNSMISATPRKIRKKYTTKKNTKSITSAARKPLSNNNSSLSLRFQPSSSKRLHSKVMFTLDNVSGALMDSARIIP